MNEADRKLVEQAQRDKLEDQAAAIAVGTPLPGALRDVFAPQPDIKVGKYSVRPFYDADFEFLQALEHPFAVFAMGQTKDLENFVPRGMQAWQLIWLLTTPIETVDETVRSGGVEAVKTAAKAEFGRYQLGALVALFTAVVQQLTVYSQSVVGYGAADAPKSKDEKEAAKREIPPSPSPATL